MVGVRDDGFEVFDPDDDVHLLSSGEVLEICRAERNGSLKGLLENCCGIVSTAARKLAACLRLAFAIGDLLGEACIRDPAVLRVDVQLLSLGTEVVYCLFQCRRVYFPAVLGGLLVKQCVHDLDRLVRQLVRLGNPCRPVSQQSP